jgi:hypothetical protein
VEYDGLVSTTLGDMDMCMQHSCQPITEGSPTVEIGGLPAARAGDGCYCMAHIAPPCSPTVEIGGAPTPYSFGTNQNCYGYASDYKGPRPGLTRGAPAYAFRQPGETSGAGISSLADLNASTVQSKLTADLGPAMSDPSAAAPDGMHKAMFFATPDIDPSHPDLDSSGRPNWDYHVYRQDSDGYWSHKPGQSPVRRFDSACRPITDPRAASRLLTPTLSYSQYLGTWLVPNNR